jgi:hypothetical protein
MDPRAVTPLRISDARELQTGHQVESLTSTTGLQVEEEDCLSVELAFGGEDLGSVSKTCQETVEN